MDKTEEPKNNQHEAAEKDVYMTPNASQDKEQFPGITENDTSIENSQYEPGSTNSAIQVVEGSSLNIKANQSTLDNMEGGLRKRKVGVTVSSVEKGDEDEPQVMKSSAKGKERCKDDDVGEPSRTKPDIEDDSDGFSCNICFDATSDPVLTLCGHLYCWTCLAQWLERSLTCPVCKAGCDKEKVIPIYSRGKEETDPRKKVDIPQRPAGQRPPQQPNPNAQFFGFDPFIGANNFHTHFRGGGIAMNFGFGLFPTLMRMSYGFPQTPEQMQQPAGNSTFTSRLFMMIAALTLVSILLF
ncbi:hypothetical protein H4219_003280 [Mycoemilia scoparia]|uniref:RING-type E3 ubiquitin transferase n=1 Tax=Mycoemilia scoparia TaxID=417184 RepID=A0A9W8A4M5_9FUNG|nr:hypothetical protein H4219_003280 [Mycoemilia scoparia]